MVRQAIGKFDRRTAQHKSIGGRNKGVGRNNDFIARVNVEQDRAHL